MHNLTIIIVVLLLSVGVFFVYKGGGKRGPYNFKSEKDFKVEPDIPSVVVPDAPVDFGYKCQWLSIKTDSPEEVVRKIGLEGVQMSSWENGIKQAYEDWIFVSPSIDGWVFVVGVTLPFDEDNRSEGNNFEEMLNELSLHFSEVQYFGSHRVVEYHAWAKAMEGRIVRRFAYLGDQGRTLYNTGEKSPAENELGLNYFNENSPDAKNDEYWEREDLTFPSEEHVMQMAGKWSINPMELSDMTLEKGTGFLGKLP